MWNPKVRWHEGLRLRLRPHAHGVEGPGIAAPCARPSAGFTLPG